GHAVVHPRVVAGAPHARGLYPLRTMLGTILLVKEGTAYPVGIALHGEGTPMQMGQQHRSDAHEVVDHLPLGEASLGIQDLVKIRHLEVLTLDVNYHVFGHWFVLP